MGWSEAGNIFSNPLPPGKNKIGSPGLAWGFETRIIDRAGADVRGREPGEVLIRGAAVSTCYYKEPEGPRQSSPRRGGCARRPSPIATRMATSSSSGGPKELIIKAGVNIAPKQIDEVLESHPTVLEAAVVGVPHHGKDLIAFVVLHQGMEGDESTMLSFCREPLGPLLSPTRIHFVTELPGTPIR